MPRLTKALPKYRHHRASGQAVVTIAGQDVYLGPHGTKASKIEYDRVVAEWLAAGRPPRTSALSGKISLAGVMVAYMRHVKQRYVKNGQPTSEQHGIRAALRPLRELYARHPAAEFGPLSLKAVRGRMIEAELSRGTINQNIGRIKRMFKWASSEELVHSDAYHSLSTVAGLRKGQTEARETEPVQPACEADVDKTLLHLPAAVADMIRLQRLTGMRPGEVCILRPSDVDRSGDVWAYRPESHKTEHHGRERVVFVGPKAQHILPRYLLRADDAHCFSPRDSERKRSAKVRENRRSPMTPSQAARKPKRNRSRAPGDRYSTNSFRQAVARACKKVGVPVWSPNQLRHAAATEIRQRYGLEAAQVALGHAAADVTQIYAERDSALARRIAREVG